MENSIIYKLYGKELIASLKELLKHFVSENYDVDNICRELEDVNESIRVGLYLLALEDNNEEMALKISQANKVLNDKRKEDFLDSYKNGKAERFLEHLSKADKISLMTDLGINVSEKERARMNKEKKEYYRLISKSIIEDQELDKRNGIDRFITYKKETS